MPQKPSIFISHASEDSDFARRVKDFLVGHGADVWLDSAHMGPGDFVDRINKALRRDVLVLILSPFAIGSDWVHSEMNTALTRSKQCLMQPPAVIMARPCDVAAIPPLWTNFHRIDATKDEAAALTELARQLHLIQREDTPGPPPEPIGRPNIEPPPAPPKSTQLSAMLREMSQALADEMNTVKRSPKEHIATDGTLIGRLEGQYLYGFSLEEPWEPQEDVPLTVRLHDNRKIQAAVVTCSGTKITIQSTDALPDDDLGHLALTDDPTQLLEALRKALASNNETGARLGSKVFRHVEPHTGTRQITGGFPALLPNASQRQAIEKALGSEVSFIIGPPGTGKTATLAAIAYTLLCEGRTILIAAHTNIAVDNAILKLAQMCYGSKELDEGRIVRFGAPRLPAVRAHDHVYPPNLAARLGNQLERERAYWQSQLKEATATLSAGEQKVRNHAKALATELETIAQEQSQNQLELLALESQEQRRLSQIDQGLAGVHADISQAEQQLVRVRDQLAQLAGQRISYQSAITRHEQEEKDLTLRISGAQRMSTLGRLFRRINIESLMHRLAEIQYQVSQNRRLTAVIEVHIGTYQNQRAILETQQKELREQLARLEQKLGERTPEADRILLLRDQLQPLGQHIDAADSKQRELSTQWSLQRHGLERTISEAKQQLDAIELQLVDLEKRIVENARVVATTLTKTYMNSSLRERRFDAVILDEVSIAPMPAVYVAASHANGQVILIGDPMQLPPIVQAETTAANKWLKRDLFTAQSMTVAGAAKGDSRSTLLDTQFRMVPEISIIARKHVYQPYLKDGDTPVTKGIAPVPGRALVLCDTSDANPIVSRPASNKSRFNAYHIECSLALAKEALDSLADSGRASGEGPRVGIIAPYAPHAQRLARLVKARGLDGCVQAGTIHRFQGLEFDAIVFDTVESPPIDPKLDFTDGSWGSTAMRLINVAVTRARLKLIIVANASYLLLKLRPNATLRMAIEEARRSHSISSLSL